MKRLLIKIIAVVKFKYFIDLIFFFHLISQLNQFDILYNILNNVFIESIWSKFLSPKRKSYIVLKFTGSKESSETSHFDIFWNHLHFFKAF